MSNLDNLLAAWSGRTLPGELNQLEAHVWARLSARDRTSLSGLSGVLGFRAALVASVLAIGIVAGGAASATQKPEVSPFAMHSAYAPSTLLEGGP